MTLVRMTLVGCVFALWALDAAGQSQERVRGLSLTSEPIQDTRNFALFKCKASGKSLTECGIAENFVSCDTPQPILCLTDIEAPAPSYLKDAYYWSGGVTAFSDPVEGSRFETIKSANDFCAANFGKNWRVADLNDGNGAGLSSYGHPGDVEARLWVDNKKSPNMTCWDR